VDAREAADDDRDAAQVARLHGGVLAARALAVVLVADDDPALAGVLVGARHLRRLVELARELALRLPGLAVEGVDGAEEAVVRDCSPFEDHGRSVADFVVERHLRVHRRGSWRRDYARFKKVARDDKREDRGKTVSLSS